jgi:hypothetical protein
MPASHNGRPSPTGSCECCGRPTYGGASFCKSRECERYGLIWAADWRRVLFDNLAALELLTPNLAPGLEHLVVMPTVTAPGVDPVYDPATGEVTCEGLPWDLACCSHAPWEKHSGKIGCRVQGLPAAGFNRTADSNWSKFWRRVAIKTRRELGNDALVLVGKAIELQARGVKHVHPVLLASTPKQRAGAARAIELMGELSGAFGFGAVWAPEKAMSAKAAAAYLSSYFVVGKREKMQLTETVAHPAMKKSRPLYVTSKLTTQTGVTMRELRFRRYVWVNWGTLVRMGGEWVDVARRLAELQRANGGNELTAEELGQVIDVDALALGLLSSGQLGEAPALT